MIVPKVKHEPRTYCTAVALGCIGIDTSHYAAK